MEEKKLGLRSVVSTSVGLVIATSCLVSLGQGAGEIGIVFIGAMIVACLLNLTTIASLSELNALMPNITGGLAQYTLACMGPLPTIISMVGGYLLCNILSAGVEASIFAYAMSSVIPLIGILGTSYMIFYISNDMHERLMIWAVTGVSILALGIYAYFWTKFKMKMPVWKSVPIEKVMAMDDSRYYALRRKTGIW